MSPLPPDESAAWRGIISDMNVRSSAYVNSARKHVGRSQRALRLKSVLGVDQAM